MTTFRLGDAIPYGMHEHLKELVEAGVIKLNITDIVFDKEFRENVLEDAEIILRDGNCGGSQCETRDGIIEAIESHLRSIGIKNSRTIALCAQLFLVEHGKSPSELLGN